MFSKQLQIAKKIKDDTENENNWWDANLISGLYRRGDRADFDLRSGGVPCFASWRLWNATPNW